MQKLRGKVNSILKAFFKKQDDKPEPIPPVKEEIIHEPEPVEMSIEELKEKIRNDPEFTPLTFCQNCKYSKPYHPTGENGLISPEHGFFYLCSLSGVKVPIFRPVRCLYGTQHEFNDDRGEAF